MPRREKKSADRRENREKVNESNKVNFFCRELLEIALFLQKCRTVAMGTLITVRVKAASEAAAVRQVAVEMALPVMARAATRTRSRTCFFSLEKTVFLNISRTRIFSNRT